MEATQKFGPNAVGFHLVTEERQWYIIGYYLAPDDTSTIESVIAVLKERPPGFGAASGRGIKHQPGRAIGRLEGGGYLNGADNGGVKIHAGPLPTATVTMVPGR